MGNSSRRRAEARRLRELEAAKGAAALPPPTKWQRFTNRINEWKWTILRALPLGVLLPVTIFFGSVGPDDFAKNYAGWARKFGLINSADWLARHATGPRVFWTTVLVSVVYLAIAFGLPFLIRHTRKNTAVVVVPISVAFIVVGAVSGLYIIQDALEARIGRLEPRTITAEQRDQIVKFVQVPAGSSYVMVIASDMDCTDCYQYAIDFQGILFDAHWRHEMVRVMAHRGSSPKGVAIETPDPSAPLPEAIALAHGLTAAGIPFDLTQGAQLDPNGSGKWVAGIVITRKAGAYSATGKP